MFHKIPVKDPMKSMKPILVVGGYGAVGQYIVADLHRLLPEAEITVAGRSLQKARTFADAFDDRVSAASVDLTSEAATETAFQHASLVILNTEAGAENAARTCVRLGLSLISVAASVSITRAITAVQPAALSAGVALVTEVGLAPGLMNLMAGQVMADLPDARSLDLVLALAMAGDHGPEAIEWTIARCIEAERAIILEPPLPVIGRWVIPVDFVDKEKVANELGIERVTSSLALIPAWTSRMLPVIAPLFGKYPRLLEKAEGLIKALSRVVGLPVDAFNLVARAKANEGNVTLQLRGTNQSRVTGLVAAKTAARLISLEGAPPAGVVGMSDIVTFDELKPALDDLGILVIKT